MAGQVTISHYGGNQKAEFWPTGSILGVHGLHFGHLRPILRIQELDLVNFGHYGGPEPRFELFFGHLCGQGASSAHYEGLVTSLDNLRPMIGVQELDLGHFSRFFGHHGADCLDLSYFLAIFGVKGHFRPIMSIYRLVTSY